MSDGRRPPEPRFVLVEEAEGALVLILPMWTPARVLLTAIFSVLAVGSVVVGLFVLTLPAWVVLFYVGMALLIAWYALSLRNETRIRIGRSLEIAVGPFPWTDRVEYEPAQLTRVDAVRQRRPRARASGQDFDVKAEIAGREVVLVADVEEEDDARFIAQQIRERLGLGD